MSEQKTASPPRLRAWHEWDVPPLWVFVVGGIILVGISTLVFMKIGESMSQSRLQAIPAASTAGNPTKVTD